MIEYDPLLIAAMDEKQLLCQLIARTDLRNPKREGQVKSVQISAALEAKAVQFVAAIDGLGIPDLSSDLRSIINDFFGDGPITPVPAPVQEVIA